jgi:hypothetical protein
MDLGYSMIVIILEDNVIITVSKIECRHPDNANVPLYRKDDLCGAEKDALTNNLYEAEIYIKGNMSIEGCFEWKQWQQIHCCNQQNFLNDQVMRIRMFNMVEKHRKSLLKV